MRFDLSELSKKTPVVAKLAAAKATAWRNGDYAADSGAALSRIPLGMADIDDAEARLLRFAPFLIKCFPETATAKGVIESPLVAIPNMAQELRSRWGAGFGGTLLLKEDSHLPISGSVKARGGIYEVLCHAEHLALEQGMIKAGESYERFAEPAMKTFFSHYAIHVASTGNLGLSIGIMSAALGFHVTVHMSADARRWKKDMLRSKGVEVVEYAADYSAAVVEGRKQAERDPMSYFVDDEDSQTLFLGYAVAAKRLKGQLDAMGITVDESHPLAVYLPCGVGGAPGGVTFGLKTVFGDCVYPFFVEPTQAPCMCLGMATGLHNEISVQDIGLTGLTCADGLAVGRPSKFVGKTVRELVAGAFTVEDCILYDYMKALVNSENIFIEPSACAAFAGPARLCSEPELKELASKLKDATHIAWATGGSMVPQSTRDEYMEKASF